MIGLVGVTGLAGAGKSTAVKRLAELTNGRIFYLGQTVIDEVRARGLSKAPDHERQVRIELRLEKGPGALAIPYVGLAAECLENGIPVFVDAIFTKEEFELFASRLPSGSARLLAISASFDVRISRLTCRLERPFNPDELQKRDKTEMEELGTGRVMAAAGHTIQNEGTLDDFYRRVAEFVSCWR